jgi:hypothetical protein
MAFITEKEELKPGSDSLPARRRGSSHVVLPHEDAEGRPL